jgi:hypothetical protein
MRAADSDTNNTEFPSRPFNGIFTTRHHPDRRFNLQITGPRRGFTASQLRGIASLIDRCCAQPVATLTVRGALDLGAIDANRHAMVNAALLELHLTDDDPDNDDLPPPGVGGLSTNPWFGVLISVDQLSRLASIMVEHSVDHIAFGPRRVAQFRVSHNTNLPDFQTALRALGFFQRDGKVCAQ